MLGVHDGERLDIFETEFVDALLRLAQHRLGNVDAVQPEVSGVVGQRQPGAHAHFEDTPADAFGRRDRGVTALLKYRAKHQVIDRRPSRVGFFDRVLVEFGARNVSHCLASWLMWFAITKFRHAHENTALVLSRARLRRPARPTAALRSRQSPLCGRGQ